MSFYLSLQILYNVTLLLVTAIVILFGGKAERVGIAVVFVASLATWAAQELPVFDWASSRWPLITVDLVALAALFALAVRSDRFWPLWTTALHLIGTTTHLVFMFAPQQLLRAYGIMQGFWAYPIFVCLLIGCLRYQQNLRAGKATAGT